MSTVHLHLTLQQVGERHAATIRREGQGMPYGLTRAFHRRIDAERWLIENARSELANDGNGEDAAA